MKMLNIAAAAALSIALATPATAMVSRQDLDQRVQSAVDGGGHVQVTVDGDTAYLSGWVYDSQQRHAAARAALGADGIERVVNTIAQ